MIWLILISLACILVAAAAMRRVSKAPRRIAAIVFLSFALYLVFWMPSGGADNPLPLLLAFLACAVAVGAMIAEVVALLDAIMKRSLPHNG